MPTTDVAVVEFTDIPPLPEATPIQPTWLFLVQDNVSGAVWRATSTQAKTVLVPVVTALPQPLAATFADFIDTNLGGSVRLVPALGVPIPDYRYKVGADGNYAPVPTDGVITVGNVSGQVFAFAVATAARQQSPTASSPAFSSYIVPVDPATVVTTPAAPSFANFRDTNAGGSVQLVAADGVPMSDYRYKVGTDGFYVAVPLDGIITVGNVDGQVFAYSIAVSGRNPSATSASPTFTSYVATPVGTTTPPPPAFISFIDTNAGGSVQLLAATGIPMSDYLYKVASDGLYQPVPADGLITVGNITGPVYAYSVASGTRNQSQIGLSASFTSYTAPVVVTITVPGAPTAVYGTAGNNAITVYATPPANTGGAAITGYCLYRNGSASALATNVALPYIDNTALNGTAYTYEVAAINSAGIGPKSSPPSVAVTPVAPAAPTFNTTLDPGGNVSSVTYNGAVGTQFKFNVPLSANTAPNPATMQLFFPAGTNIGQVDFSGFDAGTQCAVVINGTLRLTTFTNGNVTLS